MNRPEPLKTDSLVRVIGVASPVERDALKPGIEFLESLGLDVELDVSVADTAPRRPYLAGPDSERARRLQQAFDSPEVDALWFSRGGYGTMRLLPRLDLSKFEQNPSLLIGYSDLTALFTWISGMHGIPTVHGPMVKSITRHLADNASAGATLGRLGDIATGRLEFPRHHENLKGVHPGRTEGRLLGGNLSVLSALIGSPYVPDLEETILFVEECGEADYRLDRLMTALALSAKTDDLNGIVLGQFTGCDGNSGTSEDISGLIEDLATDFDVPVVSGFPAGHGDIHLPLPLGTRVRIDGSSGSLAFLESPTNK